MSEKAPQGDSVLEKLERGECAFVPGRKAPHDRAPLLYIPKSLVPEAVAADHIRGNDKAGSKGESADDLYANLALTRAPIDKLNGIHANLFSGSHAKISQDDISYIMELAGNVTDAQVHELIHSIEESA